jgi:hypothetical protein
MINRTMELQRKCGVRQNLDKTIDDSISFLMLLKDDEKGADNETI